MPQPNVPPHVPEQQLASSPLSPCTPADRRLLVSLGIHPLPGIRLTDPLPNQRGAHGLPPPLAVCDTLRLADGSLAEHGLLAMASDLWAKRPESRDPKWVAVAWGDAVLAYRLDT